MKWLPLLLTLTLFVPALGAEESAAGDGEETRTLIWPDGTRYVGGVKDGKRWGKGTIFWEDGTRFVGNFRDDLREGPGTMILPDGTVYNGYFSNDKLVEAPAEPADPDIDIAVAEALAEEAAETTEEPAAAQAQPEPDPREIEPVRITEITDAVKSDLTSMIDLWAAAWSEQNVPQYLAYYSEDFDVPGSQSRRSWEGLRRQRLSRPGFIDIGVTYERFEIVEPDVAAVTFNQSYRSDVYSDQTTKTLPLANEGPFGRILREESQ